MIKNFFIAFWKKQINFFRSLFYSHLKQCCTFLIHLSTCGRGIHLIIILKLLQTTWPQLILWNLMVARLVSGGSLHAEAEQIIGMRKTAFNKALREYKKDNSSSQNSTNSTGKKTNRQSKHARNQSTQNAI